MSEGGSPPLLSQPNCAICQQQINRKCFAGTCCHEFCYECLLTWSKVKPECPLCKKWFAIIIHNVTEMDQYDVLPIPSRFFTLSTTLTNAGPQVSNTTPALSPRTLSFISETSHNEDDASRNLTNSHSYFNITISENSDTDGEEESSSSHNANLPFFSDIIEILDDTIEVLIAGDNEVGIQNTVTDESIGIQVNEVSNIQNASIKDTEDGTGTDDQDASHISIIMIDDD